MNKPIWETWDGERYINHRGERHIATETKDWSLRFGVWKREYCRDQQTTCPCPVPAGHIMFKRQKAN
jgi:hypothetical protein